jgi:hypothetical protein
MNTADKHTKVRDEDNKSVERLKSVDAIRTFQREWLEAARAKAVAGEPFAICHGDEFEEIFNAMEIGVMVANYWNFLIIANRQSQYFTKVLEQHGYPGPHFLGLGYGASIDPVNAPWGGLPKPLLVLGSTRDEEYLRLTELWARQLGCPCYPLDFGFSSQYKQLPPDDWWKRMRDEWEHLIDVPRLEQRIAQNKGLIRHLEAITGRTFSVTKLQHTMDLVNIQVDLWDQAHNLIAAAKPCPVSLRDQLAVYQAMWHRGTEKGVELIKAYLEEVRQRISLRRAAYPGEKFRLLYWTTREAPAFQSFLEKEYGAVFVGTPYGATPRLYARTVHNGDPLRALSARQLFLFILSPGWMIHEAELHQCDAIVLLDSDTDFPSENQMVAEQAGIPCISIPNTKDDEATRTRLSGFIETRLRR